jgi:hypothetical protein
MHRTHKHRCLCSIPPEGVSVRSKLTHYLPHRGSSRSTSPRKLHHRGREHNKGARGSILLSAPLGRPCSRSAGRLSAEQESRFALLVNLRLPHYTSIHPVFHHRQQCNFIGTARKAHNSCKAKGSFPCRMLLHIMKKGSREIRNAQRFL